ARGSFGGGTSGLDHVDVDGGVDLAVEADADPVGADRLDRVLDLDAAAVQLGAVGGADGLGDVGGGHGAEQAAALAGTGAQRHAQRLELVGDLLAALDRGDLAGRAGLLDRLDLALGTAGPLDGETAGDEVVAAVAVADLDDVAGLAEPGDLLGQDELHVRSPLPQRAVLV